MGHYDKKEKRTRIVFSTIFLLLVLGLAIGGYVSYKNFEQEFRHQTEHQISAIAELKMNQLVNWRKERLADAAFLYRNVAFSVLVESYFKNVNDVNLREQLFAWLDYYQINDQYDSVRLLDADGREKFSIPAGADPLGVHLTQDALASIHSNKITFLDFHRKENGEIGLFILVPIFTEHSNNRPLGALVLSIDPHTYLFPYLQTWPTSSASAETLLIRREGNDALFLNDLLFKPDAALTLRFPLTDITLPAVKAVLGQTGIVEGIDYRGKPVIADVRPIPDSPWFLVSKMDTAEVYAPLRARLWQTFGIIIMAIFVVGASLVLIWRQQRILFYRSQVDAAVALRESEAVYRQAIEVAGAVPYLQTYNAVDIGVQYSFIGEGIRRITGYGPEEFNGVLWDSITLESVLLEDLAGYSWEDAIHRVRSGENPIWKCEHRIRARDGEVHWVFESAVELRNEKGVAHGSIGLFQDITERKKSEEALRESEERYRTVVSNAPVVTFVTDEKGIFTLSEGMGLAKLGLQPGQVVGLSVFDVYRDYPAVVDAMTNALNGQSQRAEVAVQGIVFDVFYSPVFDQYGKVIKVIGVSNDVTDRKRAEDEIRQLNLDLEQRVRERTAQLETSNKELEAFSYSVSHDLRAPLRGIDGWSQALLEDYRDKLDEQGRQYIDRVRSETQRMGHLIDDMLQLSRLARAEMASETVDLSAVAHAVVERLKLSEPHRRVDFTIQPGLTAEGDSHLLEAVLANLLGNAFKFTGKREDARVEFGQTESQGQRVFFVRDNGAGFDMTYAQKLFGAFQRMHKVSEFPGTGVGLASVQRIIHRHGGRVWAEAEIDRGTTIYFTIG